MIKWIGLLPNFILVLCVELSKENGFKIRGASDLFVLGVLIAARYGGTTQGILCTAINLLYSLRYYTGQDHLFDMNGFDFMRIIVLSTVSLTASLFIGFAKKKNQSLTAELARLKASSLELDQLRKQMLLRAEVAEAFFDRPTREVAIQKILKTVCDQMNWDVGAYWSFDPQSQVLRCTDTWHGPEINSKDFETISRGYTFQKGTGIPGRIWETASPLWVDDVTKDENFPRKPAAARRALRTAFGVPVPIFGEIKGVIEFFSTEVRESDPDFLRNVSQIGVAVGQYIERSQTDIMQR